MYFLFKFFFATNVKHCYSVDFILFMLFWRFIYIHVDVHRELRQLYYCYVYSPEAGPKDHEIYLYTCTCTQRIKTIVLLLRLQLVQRIMRSIDIMLRPSSSSWFCTSTFSVKIRYLAKWKQTWQSFSFSCAYQNFLFLCKRKMQHDH